MNCNETCFKCGTKFECGFKKEASACWCEELPAKKQTPKPGATCLCRTCLEKEVKA